MSRVNEAESLLRNMDFLGEGNTGLPPSASLPTPAMSSTLPVPSRAHSKREMARTLR